MPRALLSTPFKALDMHMIIGIQMWALVIGFEFRAVMYRLCDLGQVAASLCGGRCGPCPIPIRTEAPTPLLLGVLAVDGFLKLGFSLGLAFR